MSFDGSVIQLDKCGPDLVRITLLLGYSVFAVSIPALSMVFTLGYSRYRCAIPEFENDTFFIQDGAHEALINNTIPAGSQCTVYDVDKNGTQKEVTCTRWVYDDTYYQPSVVTDFDLVCDKTIFRTLANMAYMVGMVFGGPLAGALSDRFGRKTVLVCVLVLQTIINIIQTFSPEIYSFMALRFLLAATHTAIYTISFTLQLEIVGPKWRNLCGLSGSILYGVGGSLLTIMAYLVRNWRYLTLATNLPCIPLLAYWWLIPESPRWLIARGRREEAEVILRRMARVNKKPIEEEMLKTIESDSTPPKKVSILQMLKKRVLLTRMIIMCCTWGSVSCAYFGLTLYSGVMSGNLYVNFAFATLVDVPAGLCTVFCAGKFGKKKTHVFSMLVGSTSCICTVFIIMYGNESHNWILLTLSTIGKFFVSGAFCCAYLYSAELFPTPLRNVSNGICSMCARICAIASPFLADLGMLIPGAFSKALPLVIFGSMCFIVGLFCLFLPESQGKRLPETIAQAAQLGRRPNSKGAEASKKLMSMEGNELTQEDKL